MLWHLPRLDKMMMAGTVEARSPYLDEEVVNFAYHQPWDKKVGKQHLKQLAAEYGVPEDIIRRKKKPLRNQAYQNDKSSWRRTLLRTFKQHYERGLKWSM